MVKNVENLLTFGLGIMSAAGIINKLQKKKSKRLFEEYSKELRKDNEKQAKEIEELNSSLSNLTTRVDNLEDRFDVIKNFSAVVCRKSIKDIYYQYNKVQKIPLHARKMADSLYQFYSEQFHQNSYGQLLYQEICKWEIDPTDKLTM